MPTYVFINKETQELEEHVLRLSVYDEFKEQNPHLERYHSPENLPIMSDGARLSTPGTGKADSTFEKYVINRIKESVPGNTLDKGHKTKMPREW
jgi:hypothetical protein